MASSLRVLFLLVLAYLLIAGAVYVFQRSLVFHPTHRLVESDMKPWIESGQILGYVREVTSPQAAWLVMHGNGGQAAHRDYLLENITDDAAVYVLEYPGYGDRPGLASAENFNTAAIEAYNFLRARHPQLPIGVIGESIGSGPASMLTNQVPSPAKVVLLVPFDELYRVAAARFPWLPVKWLMRDQWNNISALRNYPGPIEVYAAKDDEVIPFHHAQTLVDALPNARMIELPGTHNSWVFEGRFELPDLP